MLSTIGEAPVNSLTGSLPIDASTAINILNEVNETFKKIKQIKSRIWK